MSQPSYSSGNGYTGEQFFTLYFDVPLDAANPAPISAFNVQINGIPITVTGLAVDSAAQSVKLTYTGSALTAGDVINYVYSDPTAGNDTNAIQGTDGADAASFSDSVTVVNGRPGPSAPPVPTLSSGTDSGTLGDGITNFTTPTLIGTAAANATVELYDTDGTTLLGTTTANGSGNWSITSSTLSDGNHLLKVSQTDASSATSPLSAGLQVTIDTVAAAPNALAMNASSDSGLLGDGITNAPTPGITGHAEANATVRLYDTDGTTLLGSSTADGSGNWNITSSSLTEGSHTLTARQTDMAGNVSAASAGFSYTLDTVGPTAMALSTTQVSKASATSGSTVATLSSHDLTAVTYGFPMGNGTNDADNGRFTLSGSNLVAVSNLAAGTYHLYLSATDAAGNDAFQIFSLNVASGPSVSAIVRAGGASATVQGTASSVDYTVTFDQAVTGVDLSDFSLQSAGSASGTLTGISGSGSGYTVTVSGISGDGTLRLDLNNSGTGIQNGAGDAITRGYSSGQAFTLDHTAPAAPSTPVMTAGTDTGASSSDAITSNATPVFIGTGEANARLQLFDTDGTTVLGAATADGSGHWSITSSTLSAGSHTLTTKQTDAAGNVSAASSAKAIIIDTSAPAAPTLQLANSSDSGALGDGITHHATPAFIGSAEANANIVLYDTDGTLLGFTVADGSGYWSITSSTLAQGSHWLTVKQADLAGNISLASAALSLTIDTTAPAAPSLPALTNASDSGTLGDGITNVARPVISGTAEPNASVTLYDTDGITSLGTVAANSLGAWTISSNTLSLGNHWLTARATDLAGNVSTSSPSLALKIEAAPAPVPPAPAPTTTNIDGVTLTLQPVTLPGGGSGMQLVIPIVDSSRIESSGDPNLADIPLVTDASTTLLLAQVAPGFGLTAKGGASAPAGLSNDHLVQAILAATTGHAAIDQNHLTGNGVTFLSTLASTVTLLVESVAPVTGQTTPNGALTLTGTSSASQHTALVIDTSQVSSGSSLVLNQVDFAAVIGTANVTGNTLGQILTGDAASQHFTVSSANASSVFAGAGNDTLIFNVSDPSATGETTSILHGGQGTDTAQFSGASTDYVVESHEGYLLVTSKTQPNQHALLINTENLAFSDSTLTMQSTAAQTELAGLYQSVLGRQADYKGFDYWAVEAGNGASMGDIALSLINSAEARNGNAVAFNGTTSHDLEAIYQGIYGRQGDSAGLAYWENAIKQGMTLAQVADNFVHGAEMTQHLVQATGWDFIV